MMRVAKQHARMEKEQANLWLAEGKPGWMTW